MTALSKKRDGDAWRVHVANRATPILIEKGQPAKFGRVQTYDVFDEANDSYLFEVKGVALAMSVLERLAEVLKD